MGKMYKSRVRFQFTPLREGRHPNINSFLATVRISIHAPPRGATRWRRNEVSARRISIHAPPRGATMPPQVCYKSRIISIHAPPRGATFLFAILPHCSDYFNSRPSARGDSSMIYIPYQLSLFQFTPLREGRLGLPDAHNQRGVISIHAPPRGATRHQCRACSGS